MGFMRTVAHSGLPKRCQAAWTRRISRFEGPMKASSQVSSLVAMSLRFRGSLMADAETAAQSRLLTPHF
eukprot:6262271-Prymnesium_polylepis.1